MVSLMKLIGFVISFRSLPMKPDGRFSSVLPPRAPSLMPMCLTIFSTFLPTPHRCLVMNW